MSANLIPNSFQTPNDLVDQFMELLTAEEFKVLVYAVRHILGWKTKIASRSANISLTQFETGFDYDGKHFGGCGLSRPKIAAALTALVDFGLMKKVGHASKDGQAWMLTFDDPDVIDLEGLRERAEETAQQSARRVAKAATASADKRRTSTTAVPVGQYDSRTSTSTTAVPMTSTTVVHNETHDIKPIETHHFVATPTAGDGQPPKPKTDKPKRARKPVPVKTLSDLDQMHRAIAINAHGVKPGEGITGRTMVRINIVAQELVGRFGTNGNAVTPEQLAAAFAWYRSNPKNGSAPKDPVKVADMVSAYREAYGICQPAPLVVHFPPGVPDCPVCGGNGMVLDAHNKSQPCSLCLEAEARHDRQAAS